MRRIGLREFKHKMSVATLQQWLPCEVVADGETVAIVTRPVPLYSDFHPLYRFQYQESVETGPPLSYPHPDTPTDLKSHQATISTQDLDQPHPLEGESLTSRQNDGQERSSPQIIPELETRQ